MRALREWVGRGADAPHPEPGAAAALRAAWNANVYRAFAGSASLVPAVAFPVARNRP